MGEQIFGLSAFTGIGSALGAVIFAIWFIFGRNRKLAAQWVGICVLIFCGSVLAALLNIPKTGNSLAAATPPPMESSPPEAPLKDYLERLASASKMMADMRADAFKESAANLLVAAALFDEWTQLYEEGGQPPLSEAAKKQRTAFRQALIKKQTTTLPQIRDLYGSALRRQLWEADGKAKTFGSGYRTVEMINAAFAANRNIKQIHEQMYPTFAKLRFTRSQYKWVDANVDYTYFDIKAPADTELVVWNKNGSYRKVE